MWVWACPVASSELAGRVKGDEGMAMCILLLDLLEVPEEEEELVDRESVDIFVCRRMKWLIYLYCPMVDSEIRECRGGNCPSETPGMRKESLVTRDFVSFCVLLRDLRPLRAMGVWLWWWLCSGGSTDNDGYDGFGNPAYSAPGVLVTDKHRRVEIETVERGS